MQSRELTFDIVDDLVAAYRRGKTPAPNGNDRFSASSISPLVELAFSSAQASLLASPWLDPFTQADLRSVLRGTQSLWFDTLGRRGVMRTIFSPLRKEDDVPRTQFLMAARKSAETAGLPATVAQYMAAALKEMESNIREHSERPETGLLAFQAAHGSFEFVAADRGVGVLATLREADEFRSLTDHGRALHLTLQEGVSRRGRDPGHGNGFRDLFAGLQSLSADLRFRSGDHALLINGARADLKQARLAQKSPMDGFLAAVCCHAPTPSRAHH